MSMFANWEEANRIQQQEAAEIKARKEADLEAQMDSAGFTDAEKARWKEGNNSDKNEDRIAYSRLETRIEKVQREGVKAEPVALGPMSLREQTGSYNINNPNNFGPTEIREQKPLDASGTGYEEYKTPEQLAAEQERLEQVIAEREILSERLREEKEIEEYQQRRREEDFDNLLRAGEFQVGDYEEVKAEYFETDRPSNLQPTVFDNFDLRTDILAFHDIDFNDVSDTEKVYNSDVDGIISRRNVALISGYKSPDNLLEAKGRADSYYIQSLERSLESATTSKEKDALQDLINKGAPDFNTIEDIKNWESLNATFKRSDADENFSVDRAEYDALKLQSDIVEEWATQPTQLDQEIIRVMGDKAMSIWTQDRLPKDKDGNVVRPEDWGHILVNTGTAYNQLPSSDLEEEEGVIGAVGEYTFIQPTFWEPSKLQKWAQPIGAVLSVLYPPLAPFITAAATTIATDGDFQEGIQSGIETYVKGTVSDVASDEILDAYEALDIPVKELSEIQQKVIVDTTIDGLEGKSIQDSFEKNAGKALVKEGAEAVKDIITDVDSEIGGEYEIPEWVKKAGDVIVATGTAIGNAVEPVYEVVKTAGDVVEPVAKDIVDAGQQAVDVVQEAVQPISDFTSDVEDDILDAGRAFDDTVIDPIDNALDTFGEKVVDPTLQAGSDVLSDAEDVVSDVLSEGEDILKEGGRRLDDLINWEELVKGMLAGGLGGASGGQRAQFMPTETEGLFDKELFKFDTEIKSTQEMLSPMMNSRRYG
ncbi:hypothetical protein N9232_00470 [Akkermansiaceae bacterium]|nr:hypothetical protein [Akkermansiaceae bacterium]